MSADDPPRALDTSIILRYLTNDIPRLGSIARALIDSDTPLGVPAVALLETAIVLRHPPYSFDRDAIIDAIAVLLQRPNIRGIGLDADIAVSSLSRCRGSSAVSVGDALIAATCHTAGIVEIYTLDTRFWRSGMQTVPMPSDDE